MDDIIFTITNDLTGWTVNVYNRGECFSVEQYDVDGAYMGQRTFAAETKAITHAILLS